MVKTYLVVTICRLQDVKRNSKLWLAETVQLRSTGDSTPDRQLNMLKFLNPIFWYKTMDSLSLQIKYEPMKIATEGKAQYNKTAHTKCIDL
jgi:hypothetical protein